VFIKTIAVSVDTKTWPRFAQPPKNLATASGRTDIDLSRALLMLGTLTMPSLLSAASPGRFWAWLRYLLAPTDSNDLRITMDFADLDPHQKSILSDDFGVAISTQWLFDRYGGFTEIVDGRRFMLQFAHLLRAKQKKYKAKVGPSKTPDFVLQDSSGRWHVLECKGTQSGRSYRNALLRNAISQKHTLQIGGRIRGERLAAGLAISNEQDLERTELRVIDPDGEPLLTLHEADSDEIALKAHRVAIARALGVVGLNEAAIEISLPPDVGIGDELLWKTEARRVRASKEDRYGRAAQQLRERDLTTFNHAHRKYEGRRVQFELPEIGRTKPFNEIGVRQGVDHDFLEEISRIGSDLADPLNRSLEKRIKRQLIKIEGDGQRTTLTYGDLFFAELTLRRR
jgi:hypothetical protein